MNLITVIVALILVIILSFLLYCVWQILTVWDSEMNESTNKLRAKVEAAKQEQEKVYRRSAEFHRKGDNQVGVTGPKNADRENNEKTAQTP